MKNKEENTRDIDRILTERYKGSGVYSYLDLLTMDPVTFGQKRALMVRDLSRRSMILHSLRQFASVKLWEKDVVRRDAWGSKLSYETYQRLRQTPHLAKFVPESRDRRGVMNKSPEYFFFMTTLVDHQDERSCGHRKICCLIEKKLPLENARIYQFRTRFRNELFAGTLMSGVFLKSKREREETKEDRGVINRVFSSIFPKAGKNVSTQKQSRWVYLADDLWAHKGKDVTQSLSQRLVLLQDMLGVDWFSDTRMDVCEFQVARYADYNTIEEVLRYERQYLDWDISDHCVIFVSTQGTPGMEEFKVSLTDPLPSSSEDSAIFKNGGWTLQVKASETSDVSSKTTKLADGRDMMLLMKSEYPDVYWVIDPMTKENLGVARVRSLDESERLRNIFLDKDDDHTESFQCVFEEEFMKWRPLF